MNLELNEQIVQIDGTIVRLDLQHPLIRLNEVSKNYGHTQALNKVTFDINPGRIVGLMGGNGAGKSTMMRILSGVNDVSSGSFCIDDVERTTENYNSVVAREIGVAGVYQELSLATNLRVYENFFVHDPSGYQGIKWRKEAQKRVQAWLNEVFPDTDIDVCDYVENLSLAQRQMVEIARASQNPNLKLLILDEPTSSLSAERIEQLHQFVQKLKDKNVAVIYISHKLREVLELVDEIIVMRNGNKVWSGLSSELSEGELVNHMGGNSVSVDADSEKESMLQRKARVVGGNFESEQKVSLTNYSSATLHKVTFRGRVGEIIGVSGLEGSGQQDLLKTILFNQRPSEGTIDVLAKVAYVSGNRTVEGVFPYWTIRDNIAVSSFFRLSRMGLVQTQKIRELAEHWFRTLNFRASSIQDKITSLSGGNQQKALIARALGSDAEIILLNDPTRGVDVQTKREIYDLLLQAAERGRVIIWYSTEDKEMEYCDRVYVLRKGCVVCELQGVEVMESEVIKSSYLEPDIANQAVSVSKTADLVKKLSDQRWVLPALSLFVIMIAIAIINPNTVSEFGLNLLIGSAVPLFLVALSQMFIILSGDIDLGIGSFVGLVNVVSATILVKKPLIGLLILLLLILCYGVMGLIIHIRKIPAIVVTLGASFVWLGIALTMQSTPGGSVPGWLNHLYGLNIPVIPEPIILAVIFAFIGYLILRKTKYGIVLRGFGNNAEAVVKAGWSGLRARVTMYLLAGFFASLAGVAVTAVNSGSDANASSSYTLLSIAAVILGGSEFIGGIVEPVGVIIGALTFSLIGSLLGLLNINSNYEPGVQGVLLILVLASRVLSSRRRGIS